MARVAGEDRFAELVPAHVPAMLRAATALVGSADAEDAAQEAIVRAWQAWSTLHDVEALRPWLLRITVNVCLAWRRGPFGKRLKLTEPLPDAPGDGLAALDADPGTSERAGALDLRAAIDRLGEEMRVAVVLRYYGGLDASEIGAALGVPPATIRTRLRRGLMALREQLRDGTEAVASADREGRHHV